MADEHGKRAFPLFGKGKNAYAFQELVSLEQIEPLLVALHRIINVPIGLVTPDSITLLKVGWIPICEKFHRGHPESSRRCLESNRCLQTGISLEKPAAEKCKNGLWDIAMPIVVNSRHLATLFLGQFFYNDEEVDLEFFKEQAQRYDYAIDEYLQAVQHVPVISRTQAEENIEYASRLVALLAELGYKNLQLVKEVQERRLAEHALREGELLYKALVENVPGVVYQCLNDADYSVVFISESMELLTGFSAQTMIADTMSIAALIHPEDLPYVQDTVNHAIDRKEPYLLNYRMQRNGGTYIWVEERGQGVWDEAGEMRFLQGVIFDISERKQMEEERRKFDEQLARAHKLESLGVLAGGIAHDFNNLLVAILGHADLVGEETQPGTATHESVTAIIQASQRAANLTRQMLAYSGKGHFMVEPVNLSSLVNSCASFCESMFPGQYQFSYVLADDLLPVYADAQQLKQMLTNLVANAVESYGEDAGEITIKTGIRQWDAFFAENSYHNECHPAGEYVYLEVIDKGCGMSQGTVSRLCDPFFSTKFTGRGLGMAAVLGIVRGHKGLLNVNSILNKGTTIQVLFPPFIPEQKKEHFKQPGTKKTADGRILLVDDEIIVRNVAQKMLARAGFKVLVAQSGWEALQQLERHESDIECIILDLTMPVMDGAKTLEAIREKNIEIPVVLSSGYSEEEATSRLRNHHIAAFLQKPYKAATLIKTLQRVLQ